MQMLKKLAACAAVSVAAGAFAGGTPKALMIMVDGMRADAVENMRLPALQALRAGRWQPGYSGFSTLTAQTIPDARPSSAANHAAIATGVTAEKTKVYKNGDTPKGDFARWPSWMARVADARPGTKALYAYSWSGDVKLAPHPKVVNLPITSVVSNNWPVTGNYAASARTMPEIMSRADAPDATLYAIRRNGEPVSSQSGTSFTDNVEDGIYTYSIVACNANNYSSAAYVTVSVGTVGMEENTLDEVSIYPNPANGILNINGGNAEFDYAMFNGMGQMVAKGNANGNTQINVSDLNKGVYFLRLTNGTQVRVEKVVVE